MTMPAFPSPALSTSSGTTYYWDAPSTLDDQHTYASTTKIALEKHAHLQADVHELEARLEQYQLGIESRLVRMQAHLTSTAPRKRASALATDCPQDTASLGQQVYNWLFGDDGDEVADESDEAKSKETVATSTTAPSGTQLLSIPRYTSASRTTVPSDTKRQLSSGVQRARELLQRILSPTLLATDALSALLPVIKRRLLILLLQPETLVRHVIQYLWRVREVAAITVMYLIQSRRLPLLSTWPLATGAAVLPLVSSVATPLSITSSTVASGDLWTRFMEFLMQWIASLAARAGIAAAVGLGIGVSPPQLRLGTLY
ncbi:hypothetical protein RI367_001640 [Sorochytrium milnesiophthora]